MRRTFPRPRSLRGRVTLVAVLVLLGATAATLVVSAVVLRATLLARLDGQLAAAVARSGVAAPPTATPTTSCPVGRSGRSTCSCGTAG